MQRLLQNLMKEYKFGIKHFSCSTLLQQNQHFTLQKHALYGTEGLCKLEFGKTSNKRLYHA